MKAWRIRAACSSSTQKTMVFWNRSPLCLRKFDTFLATQLGALVDHKVAVKILLVVDAVFDFVAISVSLALFGTVAFHIHIDMHLDDLVGCKEAVMDTLLERVGVNRCAEIMDIGDIFGFLGRGGEADLRGVREVFEDFAPSRILGSAAAMAFVDDDQVEEAGRKLAEQLLPLLRASDGLIEAKIDFVGGVDAALFVERRGQSTSGAVARSMVLALVLSFAMAAPKGRKSLTIVWSISTLRSARNRMRFLRPAFQSRQMI